MPDGSSATPIAVEARLGRAAPPPLARWPVVLAMVAMAIVLTATSNGYGYHRDELYFRMLRPAWGYIDEPPLTPLLAGMFSRLLADEPWAMRIPATLAAVASVFILVPITRELGGGRRSQALCAWGYAFASFPLIAGHVLSTTTIDLLVWLAVLLFAIRAQLRHQPLWWLTAGLAAGLGMYNKLLVALLLVALAAGLLLVGPRRVLWSRWVWVAVLLALVVGSPNLIYQYTHGWPQLAMGRALAAHNARQVRFLMWPSLFLIIGLPLVPIWIAGLVSLVRKPEWRQLRFLAAAFPVLLVLVFVMGTQIYYPFGLLAVLFAVGCVPTAAWMAVSWRCNLVVAAVAVNAAVSMVLGLPLIPVSVIGSTPVPAINGVVRDSIGWPVYVSQVAKAYATLPPADRDRAVIVTSNYGEAGAISRYGNQYNLPSVYSGHNQLFYDARPPASATVVVFVGDVTVARGLFESCTVVGQLDNRLDVRNQEQGEPIAICRSPIGGWLAIWPALKHED